ncbi:MAG: hypothetical protein JZU65_02490 [Chlorobium sp.]|nr:hypothetical protein [Chlorobium sp.]
MVKPQGVILKRGMTIGHAGVTGVTGLGEQAQVRQPQHFDDRPPVLDSSPINPLADGGIQQHQTHQQHTQKERAEKNI